MVLGERRSEKDRWHVISLLRKREPRGENSVAEVSELPQRGKQSSMLDSRLPTSSKGHVLFADLGQQEVSTPSQGTRDHEHAECDYTPLGLGDHPTDGEDRR